MADSLHYLLDNKEDLETYVTSQGELMCFLLLILGVQCIALSSYLISKCSMLDYLCINTSYALICERFVGLFETLILWFEAIFSVLLLVWLDIIDLDTIAKVQLTSVLSFWDLQTRDRDFLTRFKLKFEVIVGFLMVFLSWSIRVWVSIALISHWLSHIKV